MSDQRRHPNWPLAAMSALPTMADDKPDESITVQDIDDLVLAHARLLDERRLGTAGDIEAEVLGAFPWPER